MVHASRVLLVQKSHLHIEERYEILKVVIAADVLTKAYPMVPLLFYSYLARRSI
jgi:hypothetical protein